MTSKILVIALAFCHLLNLQKLQAICSQNKVKTFKLNQNVEADCRLIFCLDGDIAILNFY